MTKGEARDVTRILRLAKRGAAMASASTFKGVDEALSDCAAVFTQIAAIAKPMDARSGRRDPSVRKAAKRKRVTG